MRCKYCGKKLREGERCRCQSSRTRQTSSRQMRGQYADQGSRQGRGQYVDQRMYANQGGYQDPYMYQNPYKPQSKKSAKAAAKAAKRRRRKRRIRKFFLTLLLLVLLGVLGFFGYRWFMDNKDMVMSMLPFGQQKTTEAQVLEPTGTIAQNVGETTDWTDTPVEKDDNAAEIARIKEQYEAGRIDYGGVMKNLSRLDMTTMSEADQVSYQNLAALAAQGLRDTVNSYVNNGYYSEAYALLNRMNQTIPGDSVVTELINTYGAQIGM